MKILFVSDVSISEVIGGAERVLYEQTTRLAARGHDVHILTRRLASHRTEDEVIGRVHEWRYRVDQKNPAAFLLSTLRNGKRLFETLAESYAFDCINFHQPFSAFAVIRSAASKNIRKIYTCHSLAFEEYASRNPAPKGFFQKMTRGFHLALRKRIEQKALAASDGVIVLSRYTFDKLRSLHNVPAEKIQVIPGGIDLDRFHPSSDKNAVKKRLGLPGDKTMLLTVRNLVPRMGLENLIRAMEDVAGACPGVLLVIGGTGPLKDDLSRLVSRLHLEEKILFKGFIPDDLLPEYYRAADIFVLPTIELEGFGLVTLEALASGTPVLGTPIGGTREILSGLDSRFLFSGTTAMDISCSLIDTCTMYAKHPDQWASDSRLCRRFAETRYGWETNISKTEAFLRCG